MIVGFPLSPIKKNYIFTQRKEVSFLAKNKTLTSLSLLLLSFGLCLHKANGGSAAKDLSRIVYHDLKECPFLLFSSQGKKEWVPFFFQVGILWCLGILPLSGFLEIDPCNCCLRFKSVFFSVYLALG